MANYFKTIISVFVFAVVFTSCNDELDIKPKGAITPAEVGNNETSALLSGVYRSFQNNPGAYSFIMGDLMGEDLTNSNLFNSGDLVDFVQGTIKPNNTIIYQMWSGYYNGVFNCNTLLDVVSKLPANSSNATIAASAKYFRAYAYFNLVTKWGGVPILKSPTTLPQKRNSPEEVWAFIKLDLQDAINGLPSRSAIASSPQYTVSKEAAQALMARVALYTADNTTAKNMAEAVISNSSLRFETDFSNVYHKIGNTETIFAFRYLSTETIPVGGTSVPQSIYGLFTTNGYPQRGSYVYYPTINFQNQFSDSDVRKNVSFTNFQGLVMVNKFWNYEPINISRLSEMYLISAEAQGLSGLQRLNELRSARGLAALTASTDSAFLDLIMSERRRELFCENHRFYDLVRTGKALSTLSFITNAQKLLLPIPQQEIDIVNNPTDFSQNPGY